MSQDKHQSQQRWINAHLDGLLTPEQQASFDRALASSASLREALSLSQRIKESLVRQFDPPDVEQILARVVEGASPDDEITAFESPKRFWTRPMKLTAVAAGLVLVLIGGAWMWLHLQTGAGPSRPVAERPVPPQRMLAEVYEDEVEKGFKPAWLCDNDMDFFLTTYNRFGRGLLLTALPPDIKAMGWTYGLSISTRTAYLLAEVRGEPVIVFIDRVAADPGQAPPDCSLLRYHRRQIGMLVLYEVSPSDKPLLLDYFYDRDLPDEWKEAARRPARW